jgi:general secretion pathway protein D
MAKIGLIVIGLSVVLAGCSPGMQLTVPAGRFVEAPKSEEPVADAGSLGQDLDKVDASAESSAEKSGNRINLLRTESRKLELPAVPDPAEKFSATNRLTVAAEGMPAKTFVSYVFGELLKVNFVIVEGTAGLDAPVSLSSPNPISSRRLYQLATEILANVGLSVVEKEAVYFVGPADAKTGFGLPIGYGRTANDVPNAPGQILQLVPVRFGTNLTLLKALRDIAGAEVTFDQRQLAFFVTGNRAAILRVLDMLQLFDQPAARSSRVGLINLTYVSPAEFMTEVTKLLSNDGIAVGEDQALSLVPVERLGAVIVFAAEDAVLERLEFWANQIDRAGDGPSGRYFVYQPRFSRASDLGASVAALIGGQATPPSAETTPSAPRDTRSAILGGVAASPSDQRGSAASGRPVVGSVTGNGVTMTIDSVSNALIFFTTGPRYESLLPLVRRLDRPPRQVLLEATVAEVTLSGEFAKGVEFAFTDGKFRGGTLGGLGLPSGGFALNFSEGLAGEIRAKLQESDSQVNVLSSPLLMVRDGFPATIQVGNDVPTVGATASDPIQSDRTITTVQYRKTGLNLSITPTINAEGAVALRIEQSISTTLPGSSGVSGAPIFFERAVSTDVIAASGQSILIGGLMSDSKSQSAERVPGLGRIPLVGAFLSSTSKRREKTELVLLVTPRIVESPGEWSVLYQRLVEGFDYLKLPVRALSSDTAP